MRHMPSKSRPQLARIRHKWVAGQARRRAKLCQSDVPKTRIPDKRFLRKNLSPAKRIPIPIKKSPRETAPGLCPVPVDFSRLPPREIRRWSSWKPPRAVAHFDGVPAACITRRVLIRIGYRCRTLASLLSDIDGQHPPRLTRRSTRYSPLLVSQWFSDAIPAMATASPARSASSASTASVLNAMQLHHTGSPSSPAARICAVANGVFFDDMRRMAQRSRCLQAGRAQHDGIRQARAKLLGLGRLGTGSPLVSTRARACKKLRGSAPKPSHSPRDPRPQVNADIAFAVCLHAPKAAFHPLAPAGL